MNLRLFSVAVLVSALPFITSAEAPLASFNPGDFVTAESYSQKLGPDGESSFRIKLSKSGKAKLKKYHEQNVVQSDTSNNLSWY